MALINTNMRTMDWTIGIFLVITGVIAILVGCIFLTRASYSNGFNACKSEFQEYLTESNKVTYFDEFGAKEKLKSLSTTRREYEKTLLNNQEP